MLFAGRVALSEGLSRRSAPLEKGLATPASASGGPGRDALDGGVRLTAGGKEVLALIDGVSGPGPDMIADATLCDPEMRRR